MKREDVITVEEPQLHVDPAEQGSDQTAVTAFTLKPIDPKTIKVGATVRLVGNFFSSQKWSVNFTKYQYYEVIMVDRENRCGMPVKVVSDEGGILWLYGEDLVLVESA